MVSGTDLILEDGLPELFYEFDHPLRILPLIEGPSDLSLFR